VTKSERRVLNLATKSPRISSRNTTLNQRRLLKKLKLNKRLLKKRKRRRTPKNPLKPRKKRKKTQN